MPVRPARWMRSAARRPVAFVALVALSAFAVLVSALTPMLLDSVAAGTLRDRIAALPHPDDGYAVVAAAPTPDVISSAFSAVGEGLDAAGGDELWAPAGTAAVTDEQPTWSDPQGGPVVARTSALTIDPGGCDGIRIVTGTCPATVTDVMMPASLAASGAFPLGSTVVFSLKGDGDFGARMVGTYDDRHGAGRIAAHPGVLTSSHLEGPAPHPVLGSDTPAGLPYSVTVTGLRAIAREIRPQDVTALRRSIAAARLAVTGVDGAQSGARVVSGLPEVLGGLARQQAAAATITSPIGLEALGLAWFALASVCRRMARARAGEWAIGRTRGLRRRSWLASVFLEPAVAILAGAVIGLPIAVLVAAGATRLVLGAPVAVDPATPFVLGAAVLAAAGSLVGLVASSARRARLPLDILLRDTTEPRRSTGLGLAAQVAAVLVTAVVLWSALTSPPSSGPQVSLLLPMLIALVIGIVVLRVTVLLIRRGLKNRPRSLPGLGVGRALARAPSVLAGALLVLVATALAGYSLQLGTVSDRAQDDRADLLTGAATVASVAVPKGVSLLSAVRAADPAGRTAMAVQEVDSPGARSTDRVVAVDTTRLGAISTWRRSWQGGSDLAALRPRSGPDLTVRGERLSLQIGTVRDGTTFPLPGTTALQLSVTLAGRDGWTLLTFGALRTGLRTAAMPCADGCRVVSVGLADSTNPYPQVWGATFTIRSIATDVQPAAVFVPWLDARRWRNRIAESVDPSLPSTMTPEPADGVLRLEADDSQGGATATAEPAVGAAVLPAVVSSATDTTAFTGRPHAVFGSSLAGTPLVLDTIGTAPALPRSLRDGVLVDLAQMDRFADPARGTFSSEVWLSPGAHPGVLAALARQGVRVLDRATAAEARAAARRTAVPRSIALAPLIASTAVLFALLAVIAGWVLDAPARRGDRRALRLAGASLGALRRMAAYRFVLPNAAGVLFGVIAGVVAFQITGGRLPLLAGETAGPPIDVGAPILLLLALAGAVIALIALTGLLGARIEQRTVER